MYACYIAQVAEKKARAHVFLYIHKVMSFFSPVRETWIMTMNEKNEIDNFPDITAFTFAKKSEQIFE